MKICLRCGTGFDGTAWECPSCFYTPPKVGEFLALTLDLPYEGGYDPEYFRQLFDLEATNFWFRSRNRLICWALRQYFPDAKTFLDVGSGTGFVLSGIRDAFPAMRLSGSEMFLEGLGFASRRIPDASFYQMAAQNIPFKDEFDVIGTFDVLEHIHDDERAIGQMFQAVRPGGGIVLTVPQHPSLWSQSDQKACHVRRYRMSQLESKVSHAGFQILRKSSFITLILPLMIGSRAFNVFVREDFDVMDELRIPKTLNFVLEKMLDVERILISRGFDFPLGGSILMIAKKRC